MDTSNNGAGFMQVTTEEALQKAMKASDQYSAGGYGAGQYGGQYGAGTGPYAAGGTGQYAQWSSGGTGQSYPSGTTGYGTTTAQYSSSIGASQYAAGMEQYTAGNYTTYKPILPGEPGGHEPGEKPAIKMDEDNGETKLPEVCKKNATFMLHMNRKGLKWTLEHESGEGPTKSWTMSVVVDGMKFEGTGRNKKAAKLEGSRYALIKLFNILCVPVVEQKAGDDQKAADEQKTRDEQTTRPWQKENARADQEEEDPKEEGDDEGVTEGDDKEGEGGEGEDGEMQGKKRKAGSSGDGPSKKKAKSQQPKNALMHLYELRPGLQYTLESVHGPTHAPIFTMSVEVNGQLFTGSASSKKAAKLATAEHALKSFVQFPNASDAHQALGHQPTSNDDFTSDNAEVFVQNFDGKPGEMPMQYSGPGGPCGPPMPGMPRQLLPNNYGMGRRPKAPVNAEGKSPVMILNELRPNTKYEFISDSGDNHMKTFVMSVTVDGESFEGAARNKRLAKSRAAQAALTKIFNLNFAWGPGAKPISNNSREPTSELADKVAKLVQGKFSDLTDGLKSQYARRKVLAGVVVTRGEDLEQAQVICVTAGTKCINGEYLSDKGMSVNDFHAEILSRRSTQRYMYSQLDLLLETDPHKREESIFSRCDSGPGYQLKEGVKFHLYISTAPCGDSRIFSPHEPQGDTEEQPGQDKHPNRKARGQLRTKIESGEGTIPVKSAVGVQTWDGVMQGERLLTMSCSDKIARWNLLGIQGALLSLFVKPIYLDTITLGSLYHGEHLARAMYGRLATMEDIPAPFGIKKPDLSSISNPEQRQLGKAPNYAVNWCEGDEALEVIQTTTGKLESGPESQLCKRELFKRFMHLCGRLSSRMDLRSPPKMYADCKALSVDYGRLKDKLVDHFQKTGLGLWVKKPIEQDQFVLEGDHA